MNKKNLLILELENFLTNDIYKKLKKFYSNILIIKDNIYHLEKIKKIRIFPLNNEIDILQNIINKNITKINSLLIITQIPLHIKPFNEINEIEYKKYIDKNINTLLTYIKPLIKLLGKRKKSRITIIIHKNNLNKKMFWSINEFINNSIASIIEIIKEEFKNININLLSTENIFCIYKKNIYPYKKSQNKKKMQDIMDNFLYIEKKNINYKILKI